jgi:hypothetical protein
MYIHIFTNYTDFFFKKFSSISNLTFLLLLSRERIQYFRSSKKEKYKLFLMFYIFNGIFIEALDRRGIKVFNSVTPTDYWLNLNFPPYATKK